MRSKSAKNDRPSAMISHTRSFKRQDLPQLQGLVWVVMKPIQAPKETHGQPLFIASDPSEGDEPLLVVWSDASASALHGHVDLGTGLRTALTQIVAEELHLRLEAVHLDMGNTASSPNQGATIASNSIQTHAKPLRSAAAQIFHWGKRQCAERWGVHPDQVHYGLEGVEGFVLHSSSPSDAQETSLADQATRQKTLTWAQLLGQDNICLELDLNTPLKAPQDYQWVGQSVPRVDIPQKVQGQLIFVHDVRLQGMLHGRVIRPPYAGFDSGEFVGKSLMGVDHDSVSHIPGLKAIVVKGDFVGVVCAREEHAEQAMRELKVKWRDWPGHAGLNDSREALSKHAYVERELIREGDTDQAFESAPIAMSQTYVWPYQMHASIGPSCAVAHWLSEEEFQSTGLRMKVWAGTQNPHVLRADLALIAQCAAPQVEVIRMEASGCYGRNCADDVAADAALLSMAVKAPVRVQLTREQEHAWEPKGAAQVMHVKGALDEAGHLLSYDFVSAYPSNGAPTLALLLSGLQAPVAKVYEMGDRTANPPYSFPHLRVRVQDMAPLLRASWLRGVSALPNTFAHESFIDELASKAQIDPLSFRLQSLKEDRAKELLLETAKKAQWIAHTQPQGQNRDFSGAEWLKGQGLAYARYVHSKWPGFGAAYAAWVADVQVNAITGEVCVSKVVVGHDAGMLINPMGVEHQVNGNVLQTTSRALQEEVQVHPQTGAVESLEWGSYPILNFRQVPVIDVFHMPRPDEPSLGSGESSSVPGTAAIANAIFDATGVRFRDPPFTPEKVLAALHPQGHEAPACDAQHPDSSGARRVQLSTGANALQKQSWLESAQGFLGVGLSLAKDAWHLLQQVPKYSVSLFFACLSALLGAVLFGQNLNPNWQLSSAPNVSMYGSKMLERGEQLAQLGNCEACHTEPSGAKNAGGVPIETPFGVIYSTNITPDVQTGIGAWSFKAFERAMRWGISADGHHLYPAFPFTSFKNLSDEDMMSLYAWSMSQTPVKRQAPVNSLSYPSSVRGLMKFWNALFLNNEPPAPLSTASKTLNPTQSELIARGEDLVNGIGHCSACHTERNVLGAEKRDTAFLGGALNKDWYAPALNAMNDAPIAWSQEELYRYLRTGHTHYHGVASGPMAEMIKSWTRLPDQDLLAISSYLAQSMNPKASTDEQLAQMARQRRQWSEQQGALGSGLSQGQRQFEGSCSSCHHEGAGPDLLGTNAALSLNTNVHSANPNNLIQVILNGCPVPASKDMGFMPAFKDSLSTSQIAELMRFIRARFAPEEPAWRELEQSIEKLRLRSPGG